MAVKITIQKADLLNGLNTVSKAAASNTTLPSLSGVLIESYSEDQIKMTATDLQISIECTIPSLNSSNVRSVIPLKLFLELTKKITADTVILTIDPDANTLLVSCDSNIPFEFDMNILNADEFPVIPTIDTDSSVCISSKSLKNCIKTTVFAASNEESRPFLTGVYTTVENNRLTMVATDSWRLALRNEELSESSSDLPPVIIPSKSLLELNKILPEDDSDVSISVKSNQISFCAPSARLITRLVEGQFPPYKAILPKSHRTQITVPRIDLTRAVDRATLLIKDKVSLIRLSIGDSKLIMSSSSPEVGKYYEELTVTQEGDDIKIVLDANYLLEALKIMDTDNIFLQFQGSESAICLKEIDGRDYLHLIMPVKVSY